MGAGHGWWRHACADVLSLDLSRGRARVRVAARRIIHFWRLGSAEDDACHDEHLHAPILRGAWVPPLEDGACHDEHLNAPILRGAESIVIKVVALVHGGIVQAFFLRRGTISLDKNFGSYLAGSGVWDMIGDRHKSPKSKSSKGTCLFSSGKELPGPGQSAEMAPKTEERKLN